MDASAGSFRGLVFHGPGRPLERETLRLDPPGPGEVAVRMVASGVCRSDLHVVDGDWTPPTGVILGHEGAAIVEALGPGVQERSDAAPDGGGSRVGDLVVLAWTAPCRACAACARGEAWLCRDPIGGGHRLAPDLVRVWRPDGSPVGVYSGIGTFGERQIVAEAAAVRIDPTTPPAVAALIGCAVTTGVGAVVNTARVTPGDSVAVVGVGGVGLAIVMAARMVGAGRVLAVDVSPAKLDLARAAGATEILHVREAGPAAVGGDDRGVDHAFEAIGRPETVELAIGLTRPGGTTTLVGMTPERERAAIDVYRFVEDGRRLLGSNYGSAVPAVDFPRIARWYAEGRLPLELLITERIAPDGVDEALARMRAGEGARRVVVY